MPKETRSVGAQLKELEKLVKKVIRKSLKDNTLDYTVQFTVSSMNPGKVQYAAQISSPARGVQPITFIFDTFNDLKKALEESEKEIDRTKVELTFHKARIHTYESKIEQHRARIIQINSGEDDEVEMEEV